MTAELRSRRAASVSVVAPLMLVALAVGFGAAADAAVRDTVTLTLCTLIVVLGLQVFVGNSGIYSFGQLAFAAAGAYVGALLTMPSSFASFLTPGLPAFVVELDPPPLLATAIAAIFAATLATVVGLPLMRTSTLAIPISTFAFLLVAYNVLANWDAVTGGSGGLVGVPTTTGIGKAGLGAAAAVLVALAYKRSAAGYRLQASRENEVAARSIGVNVTRERLLAFAISGLLCGAGGALAVQQSGALSATTFYFGATVTTLTMLVVGGTRSVFGAVVGTLSVALVNELLHGLEEGGHVLGLVSVGETPGLAAIGLGLILLLTITLAPSGISGGREAAEMLRLWRRGTAESSSATRSHAASAVRPRPNRGELRVDGVSLSFAGLGVLRDVDLSILRGESLGLIGPNGAGKTSLLNVISGFQAPDSGRVTIDGTEVTRHSPAYLSRAGLARTFQAALPFAELTVLESVAVGAMGAGLKKRSAVARAGEILTRFGLAGEAHSRAAALPPGEQRLLGLARALATEPRYLLLDEPAAGLNESERISLSTLLREILADFGCGMLLVEHDVDLVMEICPRVQVLEDGATLRVGPPAEVQADPAVIEAYLGSSFQVAQGA